MGPREKKESPSPRKQMKIDGFFNSVPVPVTNSVQKRPRDEEPGEGKESPTKRYREVTVVKDVCSNNNEIDSTPANNNNNNNNNINNKEKAPAQLTVVREKSPEGFPKKPSDKVYGKTPKKENKNISPQKGTSMVTKIEKVDLTYMGIGGDSDIVDDGEMVVTPHPLINIPESDHLLIVPQDGSATMKLSEGEFIGPDMPEESEDMMQSNLIQSGLIQSEDIIHSEDPIQSEEYHEAEQGAVPDLLPIGETSLPALALTNEMDSRILTPSPNPSTQVPQKSFKCKVCDKWFPNRYFQRKHMLMEHEDQLYECRVCSYNSCDPEKLKSHIIKMHVAKRERTELVTIDEAQYDLDELMTKQTPRKVIMEDGVALGRDPSSKMRFICAICDRIYTSKYSLERHVRCHTGEKPYTCDVCKFTTSYREHMQRHMTSVHLIVHSDEPKQKYIPKHRKKTEEKNVSTEDDNNENGMMMVNEVEESHDGSFESNNSSSDMVSSCGKKRRNILRKRFECAACGLKATHKTDLIDHIRDKHPNAHIESLENGDGSKVHLIVTASKKATTSRRMVITCPNCFMIFHDTWKYKVHMRSHTGVKPFGCSLCNFRATSKMTIRDHVHRKHKDAVNPKILLRTVGIDGTVQHVELSFPQREFKCDVCGELFQDNYHMKQHKKKSHSESLPFSCVECHHREWARASIIIHCLQSHPEMDIEGLVLRNNKPFTVGPHKLPKCDVCDKVFSYQSQLYLHQRQHTGERTYVCDICNYRTNHKPALQKHIEKHLTGPDSPKKKGGKKNTKESDGPINFVEVDEGNPVVSSTTLITSFKKEGVKKNVKVKKENDKNKDNEKTKKDNEKSKKDITNQKIKKENEKNKKENVKVKKEKSDKEKAIAKEKKALEKATNTENTATKEKALEKGTNTENAAAKAKALEKATNTEYAAAKEKVLEKATNTENAATKEKASGKANNTEKAAAKEKVASEKENDTMLVTDNYNVP